MKRLVCEMCGSTDLIKQDGVFVCQDCGCKYSIEEARKMMVEGTVEVTGTVKVDNSAAVENYLTMVRNALQAKNYKEAEEYCNKVIEMDVNNWEAWFIKGKAVGWQSRLNNVRIDETVSAFTNAVTNCPEEKKKELTEKCKSELTSLQAALLSLRVGTFCPHPGENNLKGLLSDIKTLITTSANFMLGIHENVDLLPDVVYTRTINDGMCKAWNAALKNYNGDNNHPSDYEFKRFLQEGDILIKGFEYALMFGNKTYNNEALNKLKIQVCKNIITLQKILKDGKSYEVSFSGGYKHYNEKLSLTKEAKEFRQKEIDKWEEKIREIQRLGEEAVEKEKAQKREAYWAEHKEEEENLKKQRDQLSEELESYSQKIFALETNKNAVPARSEADKIQEEIDSLNQQKNALGLFKGKEKKALQEQIDVLEKQMEAKRNEMKEQQAVIEKEISTAREEKYKIKQKFDGIVDELKKDR